VGDPGDQPPQRGHLLRLDELVLGIVKVLQRLPQLAVARFQLLGAMADLDLEIAVAGLELLLALLHRPGHLIERLSQGADFVVGRRLHPAVVLPAGDLPG